MAFEKQMLKPREGCKGGGLVPWGVIFVKGQEVSKSLHTAKLL